VWLVDDLYSMLLVERMIKKEKEKKRRKSKGGEGKKREEILQFDLIYIVDSFVVT
jgi:hypothetical protein